jgi:adhesin/invasin
LAKGETIGSLALKVNRSEPELRRLNALVLGETALSNLKEGDVLLIPSVTVKKKHHGVDTKRNQQDFESLLAKAASQAGNAYNSQPRNGRLGSTNFFAQHGANAAMSTASNALSSGIEEALKPYGRAKVGVRASAKVDALDLNVDYLHPILQGDNDILFAQIGARTFDSRNIGNFGIGYRSEVTPELMLGGNAFIDQDFTRSHTRAGIGAERCGAILRV